MVASSGTPDMDFRLAIAAPGKPALCEMGRKEMPDMGMGLQLRVEATYEGIDSHGNILLHEVTIRGEKKNSIQRLEHRWLNGARSGWPGGIESGSRVRFYASPLYRPGGARITDIREVVVLSGGGDPIGI